ncbi:hypothetical protein NX059_005415 [Plenodomus lindquistii]|nr:hypothetical protein NX059_005415 [Plenodomus lindquistii]
MVPLPKVRAHNSTLSSTLPPNLTAIFVGGTSGIGFFTARELARNTITPHIYLIGRDASAAASCTDEIRAINPSSRVTFLQNDISLLRNVDEVCAAISKKEEKVNLLFMTCGYLTMKGRDETKEGLDRKLALHYYTRMRFITNLQPLLTAASLPQPTTTTTTDTSTQTQPQPQPHQLSRVLSILDPQLGLHTAPNFTDLSLKHTFSLRACATHASAMHNLLFHHFSRENPSTSYIHAYPSVVDTGLMRNLQGWWAPLVKKLFALLGRWVTVPQVESGERHLYAATAGCFPARNEGAKAGVAVGSDGEMGSGSYLVNWNGEVFPDRGVARRMREEGREGEVWRHTEEVFGSICGEGGGRY